MNKLLHFKTAHLHLTNRRVLQALASLAPPDSANLPEPPVRNTTAPPAPTATPSADPAAPPLAPTPPQGPQDLPAESPGGQGGGASGLITPAGPPGESASDSVAEGSGVTSTGMVVGIAVAVVVAALLCVLAALFVARRRKKKREAASAKPGLAPLEARPLCFCHTTHTLADVMCATAHAWRLGHVADRTCRTCC